MNRWLLLTAMLSSVCNSGCNTFFDIAARNLIHAPLDAASDYHRREHLSQLAKTALADFPITHPEQPMSADFCQGFKEGFVDRVEAGGNGQAPPNPPWHYLLARYDSLEGRQAQQDYYAGFQYGSAAAAETELRTTVVIPPGQPPTSATDPDQRLPLGQPFQEPGNPLLLPPHMDYATPTTRLDKTSNPWTEKNP